MSVSIWAKNDRARAVFMDKVKIRELLKIVIFDILAEILIPRYGPNFGAIDPIFFCCLIIAYILGSYHDLTWKSDFWVDLRGEDD